MRPSYVVTGRVGSHTVRRFTAVTAAAGLGLVLATAGPATAADPTMKECIAMGWYTALSLDGGSDAWCYNFGEDPNVSVYGSKGLSDYP